MFDYVLSGELDDVSNNIFLYYAETQILAQSTISLERESNTKDKDIEK